MSPLNIHPEEVPSAPKKKNNKNLKIFLGIGALIAIPVIGSTFAATINITNGPSINFAQGQVQAISCDTDGVTVTADSIFENVADADGTFTLGDVNVVGISDDCDGAFFKVSIYTNTDDDPATPLVFCGDVEIDLNVAGGAGGGFCADGDGDYYFDTTTDTLTIQFGTEDISAGDVSKITVETS